MIELLIFAAGMAAGAVIMMLPLNRAVTERDMLQATKDSLALDVEVLTARANTLLGDNLALENQVKTLTDGFNTVAGERDKLRAELSAKTPARGAGGKFASKTKA